MGYILNEFVVAYLPNHSRGFTEAIAAVSVLRSNEEFSLNISGPAQLSVNDGPQTYTLGPDGSKEGWDVSDRGNLFRQKFIAACKLCEYANIVHFKMGGDDDETRILYQTDEAT